MDAQSKLEALRERYVARQGAELFTDKELARLRFIRHLIETGYIDEFCYHGRVATELLLEEQANAEAVAVA